MVGVILLISLALNVLMLIHIGDKEEEQQLTDWDNNNLQEWLWKEQQKVQMLEEECDKLRNELDKQQAKRNEFTVTIDSKAATEKIIKEINKKIAEIKEKEMM